MLILESVNFDEDNQEVRADFGGFLEDGFYITSDVDFDEVTDDEADFEIGLKESILIENFLFWDFKIFNSANEEVSFNKTLTIEIKQEVENELIKQLENK
jgi:hypothetical protein